MLKILVGDRLLSASKNPTGSADGVFVCRWKGLRNTSKIILEIEPNEYPSSYPKGDPR
jgi:hypothetical protein